MVIASGLGVAAVVALALSVVFWGWLSDGESGSATARNVGLVLAAVVALPLAIWRAKVADTQANTAQQSLLNERYQKGAEMLGSEVLSVRLAGIYALQNLAGEYPEQYHIQVMNLFCAFVRFPTRDPSFKPGQTPIRQDVESIMEAIGSRAKKLIAIEQRHDFRLDLRGVDLSTGQILDADLTGAMFNRSILSGVNFANTNLTNAFFHYADLSKAEFWNVIFTGIRLYSTNLSSANLQNAEMFRVGFHVTNLCGANLGGANLSRAIFNDVNATGARLERASLCAATFTRADFSGARLVRADLSSAELLDVNLTEANISEANLSGVRFSNVGHQPTTGLTQRQLDEARADPDNPPQLVGVLDSETGEQLVWRGKPLDDEMQAHSL